MKMLRSTVMILIVFLLFSCNREDIIDKEFSGYKPVDVKYLLRSSISGYVQDQNGIPVAGADVKISDKKYITDKNGYFEISNALFNKNGEIIEIHSKGHFTQYAVIKPRLQTPEQLNIVQQKKSGAKILNPTLRNQKYFYDYRLICTVPEDNFVTSEGNDYDKDVEFFLNSPYMEKSDRFQNPLFGIPLCNTGIATDSGEVFLVPVFSTLIAFETPNGKPLKIKKNIKIQAFLDNKHFNEKEKFYLWQFDAAIGKWRQKTPVAYNSSDNSFLFEIAQQGYYIISKSGIIACTIKGNVNFDEGSPANYAPFDVINLDNNLNVTSIINTNFFGDFSIRVEKGGHYLMRFHGCDDMIFEHDLGNVNTSTSENITLPSDFNNASSFLIEKIYNENGAIVKKGFVELLNFSFSYFSPVFADSNGTKIITHDCDPVLVMYDLDNLPVVKYSADIPIKQLTDFDPRNFPAVNDDEDYIYAEITGSGPVFDSHPCVVESNDNNGYIIMNLDLENNLNIYFYENNDNTYTGQILFFKTNNNTEKYDFYQNDISKPVQFEVVRDGNIITASFSDSLYSSENDIVFINGYFKANLE